MVDKKLNKTMETCGFENIVAFDCAERKAQTTVMVIKTELQPNVTAYPEYCFHFGSSMMPSEPRLLFRGSLDSGAVGVGVRGAGSQGGSTWELSAAELLGDCDLHSMAIFPDDELGRPAGVGCGSQAAFASVSGGELAPTSVTFGADESGSVGLEDPVVGFSAMASSSRSRELRTG